MSSFNLAKKLQPARKAWKSFKNHLQSKLHHPKFIKAIKTLRQRSIIISRFIFLFIYRKFHAITKRAAPHSHRHLHRHSCHFHPAYSAIYLDQLFPEPGPLAEPRKTKENMAGPSSRLSVNKSRPEWTIETHDDGKIIQTQHVDKVSAEIPVDNEKGSAAEKGKAKAGESSRSSAPADKWRVPLVLPLRGIDERAEEFIAKFRQEKKLEREQSILEYEEMLKRSA